MKGVLALTAVVAASAAGVAAQDAEACSTGIHMIVARGSTETPGLGKIGVVAGNASLVVPGSTSAAVDYPASLGDYDDSVEEGRVNIVQMISEYTTRCPESKIVLLGYSQGAHVVMDAICGGSQLGFNATADLPDSFSSSIIAAVTFGDPTHNPEAPWNLGTSSKEGNISACAPYTDRIRGWCDVGDVYCDKGNNTKVHGSYFANYTDDAVGFIVSKFELPTEGNTTTTPSTSGTPVAGPTQTPGSGAGPVARPDMITIASTASLALLALYSLTF